MIRPRDEVRPADVPHHRLRRVDGHCGRCVLLGHGPLTALPSGANRALCRGDDVGEHGDGLSTGGQHLVDDRGCRCVVTRGDRILVALQGVEHGFTPRT